MVYSVVYQIILWHSCVLLYIYYYIPNHIIHIITLLYFQKRHLIHLFQKNLFKLRTKCMFMVKSFAVFNERNDLNATICRFKSQLKMWAAARQHKAFNIETYLRQTRI